MELSMLLVKSALTIDLVFLVQGNGTLHQRFNQQIIKGSAIM
jgi:hypothetical protein